MDDEKKAEEFRAMLMKEAEKAKKEETNTDNPKPKKSKKGGNKKVIILGTAETLKQAPFEDESWDIWGCATCLQHPEAFKRGNLLFEMHTKERWEHRKDQINESGIPIMMQQKFPEIPLSQRFPVEDIWKFEPRWKKLHYISNSISWMTMYAMLLGYKTIGYFGVHMATESEWWYERPNCEFYMAWAMALGIDIWMPEGVELLKFPRVYGYENPPEHLMVLKQRMQNYEEERQKHAEQLGKHRDAMNQYVGAKEATRFWVKFFGK